MPRLQKMRSRLLTSILSHLAMRYFIGLFCNMCLSPVSRLCIDTHSTQVAGDLRLCILLSNILYPGLDYSRYFRIFTPMGRLVL
jgi:hypothetical protein